MNLYSILETTESRFNFMKGLIRVAKADEVIEESEFTFFNELATSMQLDSDNISQLNALWSSNEPIYVSFDKPEEKILFFTQAIQLCWIDDSYNGKEKNQIIELAKELGVSSTANLEIEKWVEEGINWNKRFSELLQLR